MAYKHGVYTSEVETSLTAPIVGTAGLQVIVGTAPVNMLKDPAAAVNVPLLVNNYKEAVEAVGYNDDFEALYPVRVHQCGVQRSGRGPHGAYQCA